MSFILFYLRESFAILQVRSTINALAKNISCILISLSTTMWKSGTLLPPQRSCGKVIFLHLSFCSRGGECLGPGGGWGVWLGGGVSGPRPKGEVGGSCRGVSRPTARVGWGVSKHALRQTLPPPRQKTATAAGGTHPTGMHSLLLMKLNSWLK